MTTAQTMLSTTLPGRTIVRVVCCVLAAAMAASGAGCTNPKKKAEKPLVLESPYNTPREVVWAVAPLRNESGVGQVDELALTDTLVNELQEVRGLSVHPVNRTLAAMRALKMGTVASPRDADALAKALGADGVVVGTIHAYDPYDPPVLGLSLAVYGSSAAMGAPPGAVTSVDPASLRSAAREAGAPMTRDAPTQPLSTLSQLFDASLGETREAIRRYAAGRFDPEGPLGWQRYVASMGLYAKFACFEATRRLLELERQRLGDAARTNAEPPR